jgi:hypothetical protein
MSGHTLREQPAEHPGVSTDMTPLDIARSRLLDFAQGAHVELFSPADAVRVANHLAKLERDYSGLLRQVRRLPNALEGIDITGTVTAATRLARVLDAIDQEVSNGS